MLVGGMITVFPPLMERLFPVRVKVGLEAIVKLGCVPVTMMLFPGEIDGLETVGSTTVFPPLMDKFPPFRSRVGEEETVKLGYVPVTLRLLPGVMATVWSGAMLVIDPEFIEMPAPAE